MVRRAETLFNKTGGTLDMPPLAMDAASIREDFMHYLGRTFGRRTVNTASSFVYRALVYSIRDRLMERWARAEARVQQVEHRRMCYLSLEYLMGRLLRNALLNLGIEQSCEEALHDFGLSLADLAEMEHDTGLGNGGLGRLAACFLDSCATLRLPVIGYGIRYQYGMFRQLIDNGYQVEEPDLWLHDGFPWELEHIEHSQCVKFGGRTEQFRDTHGRERYRWVDTHEVLAVPFDVPVPGFHNDVVNTLRLWSAKGTSAFDLEEFNAGSYTDAVAAKNEAENITMVLYPNAVNEMGRELRLRQQYFLASASLQDVLRDWHERKGSSLQGFEQQYRFQLNDTHPAVAVPELMRLLMDEHGMDWEPAWRITTGTMAYTNHTLLPEALELWSVDLFGRLLPRILDIIFEINARFLAEVSRRWPGDVERLQRMSLIQEGEPRMIRMAYLAIVGSFSVNGVAELHSRLLREGLFKDFHELQPTKFNNKTNGVTQRRWLAACNPGLAALITQAIGDRWIVDLDEIGELRRWADDAAFRQHWQAVKTGNKEGLARLIAERTGIVVDPSSLFDVQVKRIHEYKRQLLNILHAIHLYARIKAGDTAGLAPRTVIIGGKAAPGYAMAKKIIKLANNVANVINSDPAVREHLCMVFLPDYSVSVMERVCTAADLSVQISTAGKEASGTGNMKLMMNGALTIGTLDGANVEILDAVGAENFFLFGLTVDQIAALRPHYEPRTLIAEDPDIKRAVQLLACGYFNQFEPGIFDDLIAGMLSPTDEWMTVADLRSFIDAQQDVASAFLDVRGWTSRSIRNVAASGRFSADRTISNYNQDIWQLEPIEL
jgi:starch phosphorylase